MSRDESLPPRPDHTVLRIADAVVDRFIEDIRVAGQHGRGSWNPARIEALAEEGLQAFDRYLVDPNTTTALTALGSLALIPIPPSTEPVSLPAAATDPMVGLTYQQVLAQHAPGSREEQVDQSRHVLTAMLLKCTPGVEPESMDPAVARAAKALAYWLEDNIIAEALPAALAGAAQDPARRTPRASAPRSAEPAPSQRQGRPGGLLRSSRVPVGPVADEVARAAAARVKAAQAAGAAHRKAVGRR